jgi:hypothetical protein
MNTDIVTIQGEMVVTERAYRVVLDRVIQLRDSHKGIAKAGDLAKYYGVPKSMIQQIFRMIADRRALDDPQFLIEYKI